MISDSQKGLADYVRTGSEAAFREVVDGYLKLVYSTALRLVNNDLHLAQDVAQLVFSDLARMAGSISPNVRLGGWLHRHTCFIAANMMRGERRREARERQAVEMNAINRSTDPIFDELAPILDDAINRLGEEDRTAILLRFFEERDFRSIGQALGGSENAAQKRVSRALDQLRGLLTQRGVTVSAAALGATITSNAVALVPTGLAGGIAGTALADAAAYGPVTSLFRFMATKMQVGFVSAILIAGTAIIVQQHRINARLRAAAASQREQIPEPDSQLDAKPTLPTQIGARPAGSSNNLSELLRLRGEIGVLRRELQQRPTNKAVLGWAAAWNPLDLTQFPDSTAVIHASMATNVGTATPAALLQTWLWAQRTGDAEGLLKTAEWPAETSEEKKLEWISSMQKYASRPKDPNTHQFEDYRLSALLPMGDDYYVALFGEYSMQFGSYVGHQVFHKVNGEWKVTTYTPGNGTER
jgi:RNA polymerase sigma factor (sigma-70 family)